jgi:hypothetical protein
MLGRFALGNPLYTYVEIIHSDYIFPCDSGSLLPSSPRRSGVMLGRITWGNPLLDIWALFMAYFRHENFVFSCNFSRPREYFGVIES